jgi:hypothetical protein
MEIEFTVDVLPGLGLPGPRFETADYLMASGVAGSLGDAFRGASTNMARWLEKKYGLKGLTRPRCLQCWAPRSSTT